ncbi:hypothetical protein G7Y89_g6820 [Cudoniella acicularis]|uniref:Prokaryotic-type class I peptide chain release factors domain-containing protein n=1 Tax=Cudoniella acicularis TaxID=354080 RepID=A0A8H4RM09_9HELO|nr:hypothetical protein G7Y89_g6820 [Cudoniella acicularis]
MNAFGLKSKEKSFGHQMDADGRKRGNLHLASQDRAQRVQCLEKTGLALEVGSCDKKVGCCWVRRGRKVKSEWDGEGSANEAQKELVAGALEGGLSELCCGYKMAITVTIASPVATMLQSHAFKICVLSAPFGSQFAFLQNSRAYSSRPGSGSEEDFQTARQWFLKFSETSLPTKIAKTEYVRSSGPGGQKVNKTSSKAVTSWPVSKLLPLLPQVLHDDLRKSSYYVSSSDTIKIDCDSHRTQSQNQEETHERLVQEIKRIYRSTVPGATSKEQKDKVSELLSMPRGGFSNFCRENKLDSQSALKLRQQIQRDRSRRKALKLQEDRRNAREASKEKSRAEAKNKASKGVKR